MDLYTTKLSINLTNTNVMVFSKSNKVVIPRIDVNNYLIIHNASSSLGDKKSINRFVSTH